MKRGWSGSLILLFALLSALVLPAHADDWRVGNIVGLCQGTEIREGPGLGYRVHTIVPENDWAVKIIGGPRYADGEEWWDTSRREAGDPSGGTGWVYKRQAEGCHSPTPTSPPAAPAQPVLTGALTIAPADPQPNQWVNARFTVRNSGGQTFAPRFIGVKGRGPGGSNYDFLWLENFTLGPGQEFTYDVNRQLGPAGDYWFTPNYSPDGQTWYDIKWPDGRTSYVYITVREITVPPTPTDTPTPTPAGGLTIVGGLYLSATDVQVGQEIVASFRLRNDANHAVLVKRLVAAARGPAAHALIWNAPEVDFPAVTDLTLQPGQEYEYRQSRSFAQPGDYFAEPAGMDENGHWGGIWPYPRVWFDIAARPPTPVSPTAVPPTAIPLGPYVCGRIVDDYYDAGLLSYMYNVLVTCAGERILWQPTSPGSGSCSDLCRIHDPVTVPTNLTLRGGRVTQKITGYSRIEPIADCGECDRSPTSVPPTRVPPTPVPPTPVPPTRVPPTPVPPTPVPPTRVPPTPVPPTPVLPTPVPSGACTGVPLSPPFQGGEPWLITQGYNTTGTHGRKYPDEKYALDLVVARWDAKTQRWVGAGTTLGKPVLAAADGLVIRTPSAALPGGVIIYHDKFTQDIGGGKKRYYFTMYLHMRKVYVGLGTVTAGKPLGEAGDVGTPGNVHIHFHLFSQTQEELTNHARTPEPLTNLRLWIVHDKNNAGGYWKDCLPDNGGSDQYAGWVVSADRYTAGNTQVLTGYVAQGKTTSPSTVTVASQQERMELLLAWPGSTLELLVTDPQGRPVDETYPGAQWVREATWVELTVQQPLPGDWSVAVVGKDVPEGSTTYTLLATNYGSGIGSRGTNASMFAFVLVLFIALFAVTMGGVLVALQRNRAVASAGMPYLQVMRGQAVRSAIPLGRQRLTLGRDPRSNLVLYDPQVSTRHAQIVYTPTGYVLTDLGSTNGTFVNGQRVMQTVLHPGDLIRVGDTELAFQLPGWPGAQMVPARPTTAGPMRGCLVIGAQRHPIPAPGGEIGRDPRCAIVLNDPQVSAHHARLEWRGDVCMLTDLGSTNGTFVNGQRVASQALRHGDEVRVGNTEMRFERLG